MEVTRKPQRTIMTKREDAESEWHKREDAVEEKLARGNCRGVSSHLIIIINRRVAFVVVIVGHRRRRRRCRERREASWDHPLEFMTAIPSIFCLRQNERASYLSRISSGRRNIVGAFRDEQADQVDKFHEEHQIFTRDT